MRGAEDRPKSNVIDLMSALQASIDRSSKRPRGRRPRRRAPSKSASLKVSAHRERQGLDAMTKADLIDRAKRLKIDVNVQDDQGRTRSRGERSQDRQEEIRPTGFMARATDISGERAPPSQAQRLPGEARPEEDP